ncbi:MAG: 4Fe-4S dicluster domain-containing protein [Roseiflexaceae bacterium]|nr:4Fe-4S dicluster domain-containing protein [Roseiflexaceae bacterium]
MSSAATMIDIPLMTTAEYQAKLEQCIHCGMCLEACPTYPVFGTEMDSPRGRIALMRGVAEGEIPADDPTFKTHIDRCLGCLACEPACPSGVDYRVLIEGARQTVEQHRTPGPIERLVRWIGLRQLMPHLGRLRLMAALMLLYQWSGAQFVVRRLGVLPPTLAAMEAILPPLTPHRRDDRKPFPARGQRRGRVAFLRGCIQEAFLGQANDATIRVLQRNGYEVLVPQLQTCCGAAQIHAGDEHAAKALARANIDAFLALDVDAVICNAGGCGMVLKDYGHLLHDDANYRARAHMFSSTVQDVTEFLAAHLHTPPTGSLPLRVTYVDSCHLRNGQRVVNQPRALLRAIPGLELIELAHADRCCGSAGTYNITQPSTANTLLADKTADILATGADAVAVTNTGCHLQVIAGLRQAKPNLPVLHIVELLDRAYATTEPKVRR